jgi:hypothetical protein
MKIFLCIGSVLLLLFSCIDHNLPCITDHELWKQKITRELAGGDRICNPENNTGIQISDVQDSRCPRRVNCFTAGKVVVVLHIIEDEKVLSSFEISDVDPTKEIEVRGELYIFNLLSVEPHRELHEIIKLSKYRVQLEISPKDD